MSEATKTGEGPEVRVITPTGPFPEPGTGPKRDEWIELDGLDDADAITEAIRKAMGSDDWEIIQTNDLPTGIQEDADTLAEYVAALGEADRNGIPACVYLAVCEDQGMTVDPDTIHYYGEGWTDSDIAAAAVDSFGSVSEMLGNRIEQYLDWEKLGRDLRIGDGFQIVEGTIVQVD
jgi:antirestriction protein